MTHVSLSSMALHAMSFTVESRHVVQTVVASAFCSESDVCTWACNCGRLGCMTRVFYARGLCDDRVYFAMNVIYSEDEPDFCFGIDEPKDFLELLADERIPAKTRMLWELLGKCGLVDALLSAPRREA